MFWLFYLSFLLFGLCRGYEDKTVYQYLVDNGYATFVQLIKEANVDTTLDGQGPYTVFAPTDATVAKLDPDIMVQLGHNNIQLQQVIKYHVIHGFILVPEIHGSEQIWTLDGQMLNVTHLGANGFLNNGTQITSPFDIICKNGVIHTIDNVMLPPVFGYENMAAVMAQREDLFTDTLLAFMITDLASFLETGEYTLFAPVDAAWAPYADNILHPRITNYRAVFYEMMKYHMVPGARTRNMLKDGQQLHTLHGTPLNVSSANTELMINNAHVVESDIPASNGVIHAIDHLLFPLDLLQKLREAYMASHNITSLPDFGK